MRKRHLACTGMALTAACLTAAVCKAAGNATSPAKPPPFKLIINYDTTRVDGSVLPDGTIDYVAAFQQKASAGVTENNNATPLLVKLADAWSPYDAPGATTDEEIRLDDERDKALAGPWKSDAFPDVAARLKANEKGLAVLSTIITERPRLGPEKTKADDNPGLNIKYSSIRDEDRALVARAMLRVASGDQEGAREDLRAADHLAFLMRSTPDALAPLVANALAAVNNNARLAAIRNSGANEATKWLAEAPAPSSPHADVASIDIGERYQALNAVMLAIRGHTQEVLEGVTGLNLKALFADKPFAAAIPPGDLAEVNWNIVLRHINAVCDQEAAILAETDWATRNADAARFSKDREAEKSPGDFIDDVVGASLMPIIKPGAKSQPASDLGKDLDTYSDALAKRIKDFLRRGAGETREAYSNRIAGMFTHIDSVFSSSVTNRTRSDAWQNVYITAMALEVYQKKNAGYPEKLTALAPTILKNLPTDPFSGKALIYRRVGAGYIIYSVGPNGIDDQGESSVGKDDIAVRSVN